MTNYNKYLTESKNIAGSIAELAIEKMEDTLADFEMFIDAKIEQAESGTGVSGAVDSKKVIKDVKAQSSVRSIKILQAKFHRAFDKQWNSMKKDLVNISSQIDQL